MDNVPNSVIIHNQLPDFVKSDYPKFVTFLEKYYEWLETSGNVSYEIEKLRYGNDIDESSDYYLNLLKRDLLPYFPEEVVANKRLFLKLITQFYKSNGTPDSVKFLFRALYNENIEIYYPKEDILKASNGKWILPLALRVDTNDTNIFNIEKTLLTGKTSKATAVVEKVIASIDRQLGISYTEIYISNIERLFETGETVTATYNDGTSDITVEARLVGALSQIKIDPLNRGLGYSGYEAGVYAGDPVTIIGGLNPLANNPVGAVATVGATTSGGINDIIVLNGGFGFRDPLSYPGTTTFDFKGGFENANFGVEAKADLTLVDPTKYRVMNLSNISVSTLHGLYPNINVINAMSISSVTTYQSINVYPMAAVSVIDSGGGYKTVPTIESYSYYNEEYDDSLLGTCSSITKNSNLITCSNSVSASLEKGDSIRLYYSGKNYEQILEVDSIDGNKIYVTEKFANTILQTIQIYKINKNDLYKIGSIGRINIINAGQGYSNGNTIIFVGGSGYGANAYVNVNSAGSIVSVTINNHSTGAYVIGGEGYRRDALPTLSVSSVAGTNAVLQVAEITGDGEQFQLSTSQVGSITSLRITSYGYDYVEAPTISLRNADLYVSNVTDGQLFVSNTKVYQGTSNTNASFKAYVDQYNDSNGFLRIFNYTGTLNYTKPLICDDVDPIVTANVVTDSAVFYGDGNAKATAKFENGLIRYPGIYLNTDGMISSDKRLQGDKKYHNYSYEIRTGTDYAKFKKPLNDIVHPIGTKTLVTRIDDNPENIDTVNDVYYITIKNLSDSFNISSNSAVSTNISANLVASVNANDVIVFSSVQKQLQNTVNVTSGSNVVYGSANSVNFINDLMDGDTITLSTGNTVTVESVTNSTHLIVDSVINVTSTSATINLVYDEVKTVQSVNANTIIVTTNFSVNNKYITASIQKVR